MAPQINVKSYVCYSEFGTISGQALCQSTSQKGIAWDNCRYKCGWKYIIFRILPLVYLKYSNFTIFDQEKNWGKKNYNFKRSSTEDSNSRLTGSNPLCHPGKYFGKETNYEIIFDFIVYFDRKHVTIRWRYLVPPPE